MKSDAWKCLLGSVFVFILASNGAYARSNSQSIGRYDHGRLEKSAALPLNARGLLKLQLERNRNFGNAVLINLLITTGRRYTKRWSRIRAERIQLGDLSEKQGGRIKGVHASHQNGLDADVVYLRNNRRETHPRRGFSAGFDESFVEEGSVSSNFDTERNWWLLSALCDKWKGRSHLCG